MYKKLTCNDYVLKKVALLKLDLFPNKIKILIKSIGNLVTKLPFFLYTGWPLYVQDFSYKLC